MKVVIFAPFWARENHPGTTRVDRFVRWLVGAGSEVSLVRAGSTDSAANSDWGSEITIRDPLNVNGRPRGTLNAAAKARKPNRLRRFASYLLFTPDPMIVWARRASRHPRVLQEAADADYILSSSPPESSHLGAAELAKRSNAGLIVDMRDGWLDEPLKPLLRMSRLQRWREARLEFSVLDNATHVFVTSNIWKDMLSHRLPFTRSKTTVLTNAYPRNEQFGQSHRDLVSNCRSSLVHAGRFTGSRLSHRVSLLLHPLHASLSPEFPTGEIILIGDLNKRDEQDVADWHSRFSEKHWSLQTRAAVSRRELLNCLAQADGLLLLSASLAAIPSKLFEYLAVGKPILAATPRDSAVWTIAERLPQVFPIDYSDTDVSTPTAKYLRALRQRIEPSIPSEFSESYLSQIFLSSVFHSRTE